MFLQRAENVEISMSGSPPAARPTRRGGTHERRDCAETQWLRAAWCGRPMAAFWSAWHAACAAPKIMSTPTAGGPMAQTNNAEHPKRYVVVAGVDFSEMSQEVLKEAARMALRAEKGELHIVHVVTTPVPPASIQGAMAPELSYLNEVDQAAAKLASMVTAAALGAVRMAGHIRVGQPDREITQVASDVGADLVVVGSHGHRGLARL